jgi:hypothetical protein
VRGGFGWVRGGFGWAWCGTGRGPDLGAGRGSGRGPRWGSARVGLPLKGGDGGVDVHLGRGAVDGRGDQRADRVHTSVEHVEGTRLEAEGAGADALEDALQAVGDRLDLEMKSLAKRQPGSSWAVDQRVG